MIIYGGYHHINKIGEFLQFSSKRKGIRAWNFRMMIRKIWQFLWYQNRNNFEKNEKRKDQAPLIDKNWRENLDIWLNNNPPQSIRPIAVSYLAKKKSKHPKI